MGSGGGGRSKADGDVVPEGAAGAEAGGDDDDGKIVVIVVVVVVVVRASVDVSTGVTASAGGSISEASEESGGRRITTGCSMTTLEGVGVAVSDHFRRPAPFSPPPSSVVGKISRSTMMLAAGRHVASRSPVLSLGWAVTSRPYSRTMSSTSRVVLLETDEEIREAQTWLTTFTIDALPRNGCTVKFSRSSGPGGQNVNKYASQPGDSMRPRMKFKSSAERGDDSSRVNSKATLQLPVDRLLPLLPNALHQRVRDSRYYSHNSNCITIQADDTRSQRENVHRCYVKLYHMIMEAGRSVIPGTTSDAQKDRVKELYAIEAPMRGFPFNQSSREMIVEKGEWLIHVTTVGRQTLEKQRRRQGKKMQSQKKASRRDSGRGH